MRPLIQCLFCLVVANLMALSVAAEDEVIFISAFKSGEEGAIHTFAFDSTKGQLKPMHQATDVNSPFFLALSPNGRTLYSIDAKQFGGKDDEFVAAYSIGDGGKLTRLNQQSARGTASCYLDVDATGKTVLVANYSTGNVTALPVKDDGSLAEASAFIQHEGSSVNPKRQKGPYAHSIEVSPDNKFAMAADLGIDKVLIYKLDADSGKLTPNPKQASASLPPGSGPRHLTFHPNDKWMYVINELKNTVTLFDYNDQVGTLASRQTISTLPEGYTEVTHTADLKITPNGKFLYGTNRGHDSIASYRIGKDGRLTLLNIDPSGGKGPQNLLITSDGRWLLCANMPGNNVVVFAIDGETGALKPHGEPVSVPMPSCIRSLK